MKTILATAALVLALPLLANDRSSAIRELRELPFEVILDETSRPGESMDAFAARLAPALRAHTQATGHEACGVIAEGQGGYSAIIGSSGASAACINDQQRVRDGYSATAMTIHSHPETSSLRLSRHDHAIMALAGRASGNSSWEESRGSRSVRVTRSIPNSGVQGFSPADYHGGPGYLVAGGRLLFQQGAGTARDLGGVDVQ